MGWDFSTKTVIERETSLHDGAVSNKPTKVRKKTIMLCAQSHQEKGLVTKLVIYSDLTVKDQSTPAIQFREIVRYKVHSEQEMSILNH